MAAREVVWFRRPDNGLAAAQHASEAELYRRRGWQEVDTEAAEAEVADGSQAQLNAERAEADREATEQLIAREKAQKAARRQEAARRIVADAQQPQQSPSEPSVEQGQDGPSDG